MRKSRRCWGLLAGFRELLGGFWGFLVLQGLLERFWKVSGEFLESFWRISGEFLASFWRISGEFLAVSAI